MPNGIEMFFAAGACKFEDKVKDQAFKEESIPDQGEISCGRDAAEKEIEIVGVSVFGDCCFVGGGVVWRYGKVGFSV